MAILVNLRIVVYMTKLLGCVDLLCCLCSFIYFPCPRVSFAPNFLISLPNSTYIHRTKTKLENHFFYMFQFWYLKRVTNIRCGFVLKWPFWKFFSFKLCFGHDGTALVDFSLWQVSNSQIWQFKIYISLQSMWVSCHLSVVF